MVGRILSSRGLRVLHSGYARVQSLTVVSVLSSANVHINRLMGVGQRSVSFRRHRYIIFNGNGGRQRICFGTHAGVRLGRCLRDQASSGPTLFMSVTGPRGQLGVDKMRLHLHRLNHGISVRGIRPRGFHQALTAVTVSGKVPIRRMRGLLKRIGVSAAVRCTVIGRDGIGVSRQGCVG